MPRWHAPSPRGVMAGALPPPPERGRTLVLGAGKAGGAMAAAVDALWPADAPLSRAWW
jgi:glycerate 2-kinase